MVLADEAGRVLLPSAIWKDKVGYEALGGECPALTSIKRFMGRRFSEVNEEMKMVPYSVGAASNGDVRVKIGSDEYAPPQISAMVLQKLKHSLRSRLKKMPKRELIFTFRFRKRKSKAS